MDMSEPRADDDLPEMFRMMVSRSELAEAVRAFLAKYDELEPEMTSAFQIAAIHGCGYDGSKGNWGAELKALREAVK